MAFYFESRTIFRLTRVNILIEWPGHEARGDGKVVEEERGGGCWRSRGGEGRGGEMCCEAINAHKMQ